MGACGDIVQPRIHAVNSGIDCNKPPAHLLAQIGKLRFISLSRERNRPSTNILSSCVIRFQCSFYLSF